MCLLARPENTDLLLEFIAVTGTDMLTGDVSLPDFSMQYSQ